jgi:hypothetical protein
MERPILKSQTIAVKNELPLKNMPGNLDIKVMEARTVFIGEPFIPKALTSQSSLLLEDSWSVKGAPSFPKSNLKRKINQRMSRSNRRRTERSQVKNVDFKPSVQVNSKYDVSVLEGVYTILTLKRVSQRRVSAKSQEKKEEVCDSHHETKREGCLHQQQTTGQRLNNARREAPYLKYSSGEAKERTIKVQKEAAYMKFSEEAIQRAIQVLQVDNTVTVSSASSFAPLNAMVEKMIKMQILRRLYLAGWNRRNISRKI